jgi:hypothetical protein
MVAISFMSDTVSKLFELFHLPKQTREAHIHFKIDEAVTIDTIYYMAEPTNEEMEKLEGISKTFELIEVKKNKEKKELFANGLFIRKDVYGKDCCVGDFVRVTSPEFTIEKPTENIDVESHTYEGQLLLLRSKGVTIKTDTGYITPKLTDKARNPWV